jgi:WD40 repeat protein
MECYNLFKEGYRASDEEVTSEPPNIYLDDNIMDIKFSPKHNVIATALVTGEVKLHVFTEESMENVVSFRHHQQSCRQVEFSDDGNFMYTGSTDQTIGIVTNGQLLHQVKRAHDTPVNCIKYIDNNACIVTGDENGIIKMWDFRISSTKTDNL